MDAKARGDVDLALVSVSGPTPAELPLRPPGPYTIGRRSTHDLPLVSDDHVSRDHALLVHHPGTAVGGGTVPSSARHGGEWVIRDTGSRHGTWLNGVRMVTTRDYPIRPGDLISIAPWSFRVVDRANPEQSQTLIRTVDDGAASGAMVERILPGAERSLVHRRLSLLLDCAAAIHGAETEDALAEAILDAAMSGAGYANVALLRATGDDGQVDLIAQRGDIESTGNAPQVSRSLIREAAMGAPARLVASPGAIEEAHSVAQLHIDEALCVPLLLGSAVSGYLYLDNRGAIDSTRRAVDDGSDFAVGLGRLAAMAMSNLKRSDLDKRLARMQADLDAAAEAQRWILPRREGRFGPLTYVGESRPGQDVGGDFFDVIPLRDGRLAVGLGDVSGKGIPASVLVTATQGFLHAALMESGDPARAVAALNAYVHPRRPEDKFVTVWVAVIDPQRGTLTYVNAGHSYAMRVQADGQTETLRGAGGVPIGILEDAQHEAETKPFGPGDRLFVYSDGLVEQPETPSGGAGPVRRYGEDAIGACLAGLGEGDDAVAALFRGVERFAGGSILADDTTVVMVRW